MKAKKFLALALVSASVLLAFSACNKPEPTPDPRQDPDPEDPVVPVEPEDPDIKVSNLLLYNSGVTLNNSTSAPRWIDFQKGITGNKIAGIYTSLEVAGDTDLQKNVDIGAEWLDGGVYFRNSSGHTRCCILSDFSDAVFDGIKTKTSLLAAIDDATVLWDDAHAPIFSSSKKPAAGSPFIIKKFPAYVAIKTWRDAEEGNMYGILKITEYSDSKINVDYKFGLAGENGEGEYTGARKVTISGGKMFVDGKEFYINGAAATMKHTLMAQYGANTCRIYSASTESSGTLDKMYEAGLMCMVGLSAASYKDLNGDKSIDNSSKTVHDEWYTQAYREERIAKNIEVVKALMNHPAVLCWNVGNEIESGSDSNYQLGMYEYIRDMTAEIKKIDPNHPVTYSFTEKPSKYKMENLMSICNNIDFICFNTYYSILKKPRTSTGSPAQTFKELLVNKAGQLYDKPYAFTEYGPTGTWNRADLITDSFESTEGRINDWGALIQLSSDEAAQNYIDCYKLIKGFENCLGGVAFWWGFQSHGEVLGWYPFFTKEFELLPAIDALESCWKGIPYTPKAPALESWKSSIALNGKTASASVNAAQADKNPVLAPGQACTAEVFAHCTSGNPDSSLKYKWFIYKDATYTGSGSSWSLTASGEWIATSYGQGMSMDEDARANLFKDRTLSKVEFTAPTEKANYRLYCIVSDPSNNHAGTVCLNFQVK